MESPDNKCKILLVEDDPNLGQILQEYLQAKGYDALLCDDGQKGLDIYEKRRQGFDICILDVMMPRVDGFTLAKEIRKSNNDIPIIFLTAKSLKEDTLQGFKIGADDYVTKPFSMEELLARIQAVLKRTDKFARLTSFKQEVFQVGNFSFDSSIQLLKHQLGEVRKLTSKESALLKLLCLHKNDRLDRSYALKEIWLDDNYFNSRSMDVYITKLRKYLRSDERLQIINVHGEGFKLVEMNEVD